MALEFKLPDIGEGIAEGEIVKWLVKAGDSVAEHQAVVEVMTDKATVEIPSPQAGRVTELRAKEGEVVPVGKVLFVLETGAAAAKPAAPAPTPAPATAKPAPAPAPAAAKPAPAAALPKTGGATLNFKLPDIGEGIAEGEIVKWLVKEGDTVAEHQPVVEVMTDKATVEIPSPAAGQIVALKAKAGQVVPIGTVIFELATAGGVAAPASHAPAHAAPVAAPAAVAVGASAGNGAHVRAVPSARRVARELGVELGNVPGSGRGGIVRRADVEAFATRAPAAPAPAPVMAPA
ncbi:MAG: biotin/lipoyl-containing protein, partial [Planctomycetota bacterium]